MKWEHVGSGVATACAVHCLVFPLLVGISAIASLPLLRSPWIEAGLLGGTAIIGYGTLGWSFRGHRRLGPLAWFTVGLLAMIVGHVLLGGQTETTASVVGALLVVAAQRFNRTCTAPCCGTASAPHREAASES